MFYLKTSQVRIGEVVANLLCEEVINENEEDTKNRGTLRTILKEWKQLHMLRWCIVDFSSCWGNTNALQRLGWRILEFLSLGFKD